METFILVVHVLLAIAIIGLIMLQQGKGAEMGASFGSGSSQTVFGAVGSGNFFSRLTGIFAAIFFVTSLALAVIAKKTSVIDSDFAPTAKSASEAFIGEIDDAAEDLGAALEDAAGGLEEANANVLESDLVEDAKAALSDVVTEGEAKLDAAAEEAKESLDNALKALETDTQTQ